MGKRAEQKVATRANILRVAAELFLAHGYDVVGMREIAKSAGLTTGALFGHFDGKASLYEAAMGLQAPNTRLFLSFVAAIDVTKEPAGALNSIVRQARELRQALYGKGVV